VDTELEVTISQIGVIRRSERGQHVCGSSTVARRPLLRPRGGEMLRRTPSILAASVLCIGLLTAASPASAEECVGTQNVGGACVQEAPLYKDCVYLASPDCQDVEVPGVKVTRLWIVSPLIVICDQFRICTT
jgi:hypothetical protein